ncbi:MAG TPA: MCP four helix bundle domain-containing protein, partial [Thermoanaerobaculia bacterium]|nr:MCP four helix bundle domain-containing protein [Thermoanaerobaculia bacterium]
MLSNWKIGKRLTFAFLVTLILVGVVAATGFWGLSQMVTTVDSILNRDAKLMQFASDLEAKALTMRRFEKDVFLNVGDRDKVAEYAEKWRTARAQAGEDHNELRRRSDVTDEAQVVSMQKDL